MGHRKNTRKSKNQPEKGTLDTNQDKSLENTEPKENPAENTEVKEEEEEQTATEEAPAEPVEKVASQEEAEVQGEEAPVSEAEETAAPEEEEETKKKPKREKEAKEEEIVEERIYTIPLRRAWISPRKKRAPRAVHLVKSFIQRHMKIETGGGKSEEDEEERLVISNEVNEKLWSRGIEKPPRNIRVRAVKDKEGTVTLYLAEGE